MTYLETHSTFAKRKSKRLRLIVVGVGLTLIIISSVQFFMPYLISGIFTSIARPFWRMEFSVDSGSLQSPATLMNENEALKLELAVANARAASATAVDAKNGELLGLLGRGYSLTEASSSEATSSDTGSSGIRIASLKTSPYILAAVLAHPPLSAYDEFIIDAGTDHGFSTTSLVYAPGGILIGRVSEVMSQTSKVILFTSPGQKYQVMIGPTHAPATATGRGGGQYSSELPAGTAISRGDFVLDPFLSDGPMGIVIAVINNPAEAFEQVLFAPPVNIYQLRWVLVNR